MEPTIWGPGTGKKAGEVSMMGLLEIYQVAELGVLKREGSGGSK